MLVNMFIVGDGRVAISPLACIVKNGDLIKLQGEDCIHEALSDSILIDDEDKEYKFIEMATGTILRATGRYRLFNFEWKEKEDERVDHD